MENIENSENRASFSPSRPVSSRLSYASILSKSKSDDVVDSCLNSAPINKLASADESLNSTSIDRSESAEESSISTSVVVDSCLNSTPTNKLASADESLNSTSIDQSESTKESSISTSIDKSGSAAEGILNSTSSMKKDNSAEAGLPKVAVNFESFNHCINRAIDGQELIDLVGVVESVFYDTYDDDEDRNLFIIILSNDANKKIQMKGWINYFDKIDLRTIEHKAISLQKVTLRSVNGKNCGNVQREIVVNEDSILTDLGRYKEPKDQLQGLEDILYFTQREIGVECYIRSPLRRCEDAASEPCFMSSITDGIYTMNLRLPADADQLNLEVGQAVHLIGLTIDENKQPATFVISSANDIKIINKNLALDVICAANSYPELCTY